MSEPNPYQPPPIPPATKTVHRASPWFGVGMILLLTPVAIRVAIGVSNIAAILVVYLMPTAGPAVVNSVLCGPPLAALAAMIAWAVSVYRRGRRPKNAKA